MPPRKKQSARRTVKAAKPRTRSRAKTRALAITADAVMREPLASSLLGSQLALFEPLRRSVVESQLALLGALAAWSPARLLINQHAAFWEGFSEPSPLRNGARKRAAKKRTRRS
jgi:hypothetical protein